MSTTYVVESGWITFERFGGNVWEHRSDDPDTWEFEDEREARAWFERVANDLPRAYRVERQCEGRAWREMDAYASLEARRDESGDTWYGGIDEARYGADNWERDHPEE